MLPCVGYCVEVNCLRSNTEIFFEASGYVMPIIYQDLVGIPFLTFPQERALLFQGNSEQVQKHCPNHSCSLNISV